MALIKYNILDIGGHWRRWCLPGREVQRAPVRGEGKVGAQLIDALEIQSPAVVFSEARDLPFVPPPLFTKKLQF